SFTGHEAKNVGYCCHVRINRWLIRKKGRVTMFVGGMVPVHRSNGAFSHVARDDQNALPRQKNQFTEIAILKKGAQLLEFFVREDPSLGNCLQALRNLLARVRVEKPKARHRRV